MCTHCQHCAYRVAQNSGGGANFQLKEFGRENFWQIAMDYPCLLQLKHIKLNLKTTVIYFTITCGAKMVHAFAVSIVVRGYHEYNVPMTEHNFLVKENRVIQEIHNRL